MAFKLTSSAILLVWANMIPLFGIFLFGWDAVTILVLYWLESVIIGALNIVKILSVRTSETPPNLFVLGNLFTAFFFTVHFGMFTWVHGEFLKEIFGAGTAAVISPVSAFGHKGEVFELQEKEDSYAKLFKSKLLNIQHNLAEDKHSWRHEVK